MNCSKCKFHCFTDNRNEWVKTRLEVAKILKLWKKEGFNNFRVYTCKWDKIEGIYEDIDCIFSIGYYPY